MPFHCDTSNHERNIRQVDDTQCEFEFRLLESVRGPVNSYVSPLTFLFFGTVKDKWFSACFRSILADSSKYGPYHDLESQINQETKKETYRKPACSLALHKDATSFDKRWEAQLAVATRNVTSQLRFHWGLS